MSDNDEIEVCPLVGAPEGSKRDRNGFWRRPDGTLIAGQGSINKGGHSQVRKDFKIACQSYSLAHLGKIVDMFWDDKTSSKDKLAIQNYLTKYGFGLPPNAPEDRESLDRFTDLLPTIVRTAQKQQDSEED